MSSDICCLCGSQNRALFTSIKDDKLVETFLQLTVVKLTLEESQKYCDACSSKIKMTTEFIAQVVEWQITSDGIHKIKSEGLQSPPAIDLTETFYVNEEKALRSIVNISINKCLSNYKSIQVEDIKPEPSEKSCIVYTELQQQSTLQAEEKTYEPECDELLLLRDEKCVEDERSRDQQVQQRPKLFHKGKPLTFSREIVEKCAEIYIQNPKLRYSMIAKAAGTSIHYVNAAIRRLRDLGVVEEKTEKAKRNKRKAILGHEGLEKQVTVAEKAKQNKRKAISGHEGLAKQVTDARKAKRNKRKAISGHEELEKQVTDALRQYGSSYKSFNNLCRIYGVTGNYIRRIQAKLNK